VLYYYSTIYYSNWKIFQMRKSKLCRTRKNARTTVSRTTREALELYEKSPSIKMLIAPTGAALLLLKDN
jgi:hypothetical protein